VEQLLPIVANVQRRRGFGRPAGNNLRAAWIDFVGGVLHVRQSSVFFVSKLGDGGFARMIERAADAAGPELKPPACAAPAATPRQ
jgi:hypothetical protein